MKGDKEMNAGAGGGGIGFCGLLTIVFIVLKLTGVITWSWFWVLSPLIFGTALTVIILILIVIAFFLINRD